MKKLLQAFLLIVTASIMSGCATYNLIKAAPMQPQPMSVVYTKQGASGWNDLPIGAYRVPESQVIVSGYQKGGVGFLFGVVGILIQDAVQSGTGASAVKDVRTVLKVQLTDQAQTLSNSIIDSGQFGMTFSTASVTGAPVLSVDPYVVLTYVSDTEVRPYVVLKASLRVPKSSTPAWTARYISSTDKALPLEGDGSFTADDGARLKAAIAKDLEADIKVMLADIASPRARDETKLTYVETAVPFAKQRVGMIGYEIGGDDQSVIFAPKIGDVIVFAGVHVLDKSVTTYRTATKDDKFKLIDDTKK